MPPLVELIQPVRDAIFDAPASPELLAVAQTSGAGITNVEFYAGSLRLGQATAPPFRWLLAELPAGNYNFTAAAADAAGLVATSAPVAIQVLQPEPAGLGTGLMGDYFTNQNLTGLGLTRVDATIDFNWGYGSPAPAIPSDHFSVRWSGQIQVRHAGTHLFNTSSDEGVRLWVNDQLLIDHWTGHLTTEDTATISLLPGQYYPITMEYYDNSRTAVAQLFWTQPGGSKEIIPSVQLYPSDLGLKGDYYSGLNFDSLVFSRIDPDVNFNWSGASPEPILLPGTFSVRWKGKVRADVGGSHGFAVLNQGSARLWVNGQLLIDHWTAHPLGEDAGTIALEAGRFYDLALEFSSSYSSPMVMLQWAPPGQPAELIWRGNFTVHQANQPPRLASIPSLYATRGQPLAIQAKAGDPDTTQALVFALDPGGPADASINPSTGLFQWTPAPLLPLGDYSVTMRVIDNGTPPMTDAQSFIISVTTNLATVGVPAVGAGRLWRYLDSGVEPASTWRGTNFDDAGWSCSSAPLGYGHGDESTLISFGPDPANKHITAYFRQTFVVPNASLVQGLSGRLRYDDGIVLYINGLEVFRGNLPLGVISGDTLALSPLDGPPGTNWLPLTVDLLSLRNGTNTIAAELHQSSPAGPDAGFDLHLELLVPIPTEPIILATDRVDGAMGLRWPLEGAWLRLYTATNLCPAPVWAPTVHVLMLTNGACRVTLPALDPQRFYKLAFP